MPERLPCVVERALDRPEARCFVGVLDCGSGREAGDRVETGAEGRVDQGTCPVMSPCCWGSEPASMEIGGETVTVCHEEVAASPAFSARNQHLAGDVPDRC
ncbi:Tat pathway signal sequence domain protein [Streptomyces azureus]|uniref:Tat pathway signal sequence domain protein n=1 Tax=Streptomyces azureus TaxID=146537 RepID=A0A0K8PHZ5_STRAJ|nr:Tat pathway signal sequence domain protein [Streptomyces azureus]